MPHQGQRTYAAAVRRYDIRPGKNDRAGAATAAAADPDPRSFVYLPIQEFGSSNRRYGPLYEK